MLLSILTRKKRAKGNSSLGQFSQFLDKIATERPPKAQSLEGTDFLVRAMKNLIPRWILFKFKVRFVRNFWG